jgi:hypothetical protein
MAKRFTDTNKYKKPFIRSLPGAYKLFWDFLYHDCDHAGIWIVDFEIAQSYLGKDMGITKGLALQLFNEDEIRIVELDGGKKWFIPSFIEFQYGKLSDKNRAHVSVISVLKKFDLLTDDFIIKPLTSPLQGAKDKEKEQEQELDKEKEQAFGKSENLLPKMFVVFKKAKPTYPDDQRKDFPALKNISAFICKQSGISYQPLDFDVGEKVMEAWEIIVNHLQQDTFYGNKSLTTISNHIQSIVQEIKNGKSTPKNTNGHSPKATSTGLNKVFAKRYGQGAA